MSAYDIFRMIADENVGVIIAVGAFVTLIAVARWRRKGK